ncbi:MAG: phage portal protein [Deltaproteobacteria bacterium]|nr:phage portal protein [Deltaproteobacteria bacterium]
MTREELERKHPDYESCIDDWHTFIRSYFGGRLYKEAGYLLQHPFESNANYGRRRATSYYYNYCGPIVDIFVSHLFRKEAQRDYGTLAENPLFQSFLRDADLEGNTFKHFIREAQRFAAVYGRVSILVDRPAIEAQTMAHAIERDLRPYATLITPENLLDWGFERADNGRVVMAMAKIKEGEGATRIWTSHSWELWRADKDEAVLVDAGEHGLGEVPIVHLYNKRSGVRMWGISDIQDIVDINKNIYYLCSDAKEIIENTAFPMLAMPYGRGGAQEKEVGPKNILQFDPAEPNARPYWLEAPHSSLSEIREWVRQDICEIYRIAKLGGVKSVEEYSGARSGAAIELEYQQLYSVLSEKADNLEQAEANVCDLWARWEGGAFDGVIDYPDDFSVRDLDRELENAIKAQSANVESSTFKKELNKKIADAVLTKIDAETMARIKAEIEGQA